MRIEKRNLPKTLLVWVMAIAAGNTGCGSGKAPGAVQEAEGAPADQNVGERIFIDTRFAEYFAQNMTGVNDPLPVGDAVVAQVNTPIGTVPGPFAGESINCRSCHFVTEFTGVKGVGNRTYADFVTHSPIPRKINGITSTPRNAMQMVGSLQPHAGRLFCTSTENSRRRKIWFWRHSRGGISAGRRSNISSRSATSPK